MVKILKLPEFYIIPLTEEIKNMKYYKWYLLWSHNIVTCLILKCYSGKIKKGTLKFLDKKPKVDHANLFLAAINMVDVDISKLMQTKK